MKISINNIIFILLMIIAYIFLDCLIGFQSSDLLTVILFQLVIIGIAISPIGEFVLRFIYGAKAIKTNKDKERILPLFNDVYDTIKEKSNFRNNKIKLYIDNSMSVNAYAMGTRTIVITKGAMESLPDNQIKGILAHEFRSYITWRHFNSLNTNCWKHFYVYCIFNNENARTHFTFG